MIALTSAHRGHNIKRKGGLIRRLNKRRHPKIRIHSKKRKSLYSKSNKSLSKSSSSNSSKSSSSSSYSEDETCKISGFQVSSPMNLDILSSLVFDTKKLIFNNLILQELEECYKTCSERSECEAKFLEDSVATCENLDKRVRSCIKISRKNFDCLKDTLNDSDVCQNQNTDTCIIMQSSFLETAGSSCTEISNYFFGPIEDGTLSFNVQSVPNINNLSTLTCLNLNNCNNDNSTFNLCSADGICLKKNNPGWITAGGLATEIATFKIIDGKLHTSDDRALTAFSGPVLEFFMAPVADQCTNPEVKLLELSTNGLSQIESFNFFDKCV